MRVFSFGGGVQSVATLVLQVQGKLIMPYDAYVFANVGEDSEKPSTLDYIAEFVKPLCDARGIRFVEVQKTRYGKPDTIYQAAIRNNRSVPLPVVLSSGAFGNRTCTLDFKVKVIDAWIRCQSVESAVVGIGFSADEGRRIAKKPTGWQQQHGNYKFGFSKCFEYPLADLHIRRLDCYQIIQAFDIPVPPDSHCWFCPFARRGYWIELRKSDQPLFNCGIALQDRLNEKRGYLGKDKVHLHRDGIDLRNVPEQISLWDMVNDNDERCLEGLCGI